MSTVVAGGPRSITRLPAEVLLGCNNIIGRSPTNRQSAAMDGNGGGQPPPIPFCIASDKCLKT